MKATARTIALVVLCAAAVPALTAQGRGRGGGTNPAASPREAATVDLTGYWVSLVTEDWLYRQVTPQKGDVASLQLNQAGRGAVGNWDPAKDEAAGEQCKAYGAVGVMRLPGRLHIDWQDASTMKIDFDAGTQTRVLHFGGTPPASGDAGYQGYSVATWEGGANAGRGGRGGAAGGPGAGGPPPAPPAPMSHPGSLKVVTTHMKPGYLRKNGVPYGANATLTEYFDKVGEPNGDELLIVKQVLDDPEFATQAFVTSTHFKKEADGSAWKPTPCSAK